MLKPPKKPLPLSETPGEFSPEPGALLGMPVARFMREHWQRKPLLVRGSAAAFAGCLPRSQLFDLARREDVESRCVLQKSGANVPVWQLRRGPFERLPTRARDPWTLLVQGMEWHAPAARALMDAFRFVPDARLDDVMVSWASEGGGVGPHFDAYDVFLVQIEGQRRWRISHQADLSLREDLPLKILQHFEPEQEWVLDPGDVLYLPPQWAHDGVAVGGPCTTASVGFRAPSRYELLASLLPRLLDSDEDEAPAKLRRRFSDRGGAATANPGRVPDELRAFAAEALHTLLQDPTALDRALGEVLTEPKLHQSFEPRDWDAAQLALPALSAVHLAPGTRMLYDAQHVFINGESFRAAGRDARLLHRLADARWLPLDGSCSAALRGLLESGLEEGWLQGAG